ncbi:NAD-dependent epimerase/dehydratase family protein [bacterium]|nr:NAD-dependent epimerase/dehydratase family protein [bacterium]
MSPLHTPSKEHPILVLGSLGQIGTDLVETLRNRYGAEAVISSDKKPLRPEYGRYIQLDALDAAGLEAVIEREGVEQFYHLVALLSATAEKFPDRGWDLNMRSLFIALELAKNGKLKRLFWPSSIAAFGPNSPKTDCPQYTVMDPSTVYGISKLSGELWCDYYHRQYGVDVRSVRYPGLISWKAEPGGGTTDYAVEIFHEALKTNHYTCFLGPDTRLPMMYMDDAIDSTIRIMEAPSEQVRIRTSYNLSAIAFTPAELAAEIARQRPGFAIDYRPDFRQQIADGWPSSISDEAARRDWGHKPRFGMAEMVTDMLEHLRPRYRSGI